jgi:hypothetical protein
VKWFGGIATVWFIEFGLAAKHGEHQSAMSGRGIGPSILERFEAGAALADLVEHVEQVARRAGQPVKLTASTSPGSSRPIAFASSGRSGRPMAMLRRARGRDGGIG